MDKLPVHGKFAVFVWLLIFPLIFAYQAIALIAEGAPFWLASIPAGASLLVLGAVLVIYALFILQDDSQAPAQKLLFALMYALVICYLAAYLDKDTVNHLVGGTGASQPVNFARMLCSKAVELMGTGMFFLTLSSLPDMLKDRAKWTD